jgi:hypothetical protein
VHVRTIAGEEVHLGKYPANKPKHCPENRDKRTTNLVTTFVFSRDCVRALIEAALVNPALAHVVFLSIHCLKLADGSRSSV